MERKPESHLPKVTKLVSAGLDLKHRHSSSRVLTINNCAVGMVMIIIRFIYIINYYYPGC